MSELVKEIEAFMLEEVQDIVAAAWGNVSRYMPAQTEAAYSSGRAKGNVRTEIGENSGSVDENLFSDEGFGIEDQGESYAMNQAVINTMKLGDDVVISCNVDYMDLIEDRGWVRTGPYEPFKLAFDATISEFE